MTSTPGLGDFPTLPRFQYVRRIGSGAMGNVYEAFDADRTAPVALKSLKLPPVGRHIVRFKNEFRVLQGLEHPNLVKLFELIEHEGVWFFTMELLDGVEFLEYVRPASAPWTSTSDFITEATIPAVASLYDARVDTWPTRRDTVPDLDFDRLLDSLRQLAEGLCALHRAEKVHRDIKPSNIVVTHDGRVVLLDFGIATTVGGERSTFVGTPVYMAPEQVAQHRVGPPADWYGFGVLLYEALTVRLPFEDRLVLKAKLFEQPPPPSTLNPTIPPEIDELCASLLRTNPDERPTGPDVLRALGADPSKYIHRRVSTAPATDFVGREEELRLLRSAADRAAAGSSVVMFVHGEAGIGKTELLRQFKRSIAPESLSLSGRCYDCETVPYKAFDGVMDALAERMLQMEAAEAAALVPTDAALLLRAFPALADVDALRRAPSFSEENTTPRRLRRRVFGALRELFGRLAHFAPVVITIDDLQWADRDSIDLITEIVREPAAPFLLLVATVRTGSSETKEIEVRRRLEQIPKAQTISLGPLPPAEAKQLADRFLRRLGASKPIALQEISAEADGHPLFIGELVRHATSIEAGGRLPKLNDALENRIRALPSAGRTVLDVLSLAGRPISRRVLMHATGLEPEDLAEQIDHLRKENLLLRHGHGANMRLEAYHGRVREIATSLIESPERRHLALALALEAEGDVDAETLFEHWRRAGDPERAHRFAVRGADEAMNALAFEHAAKLYELAVAVGDERKLDHRLWAALGDARGNAGHGRAAAEAYEEAARRAPEREAAVLMQKAAEHLLRSGHIDRGVEVMAPILEAKGITVPATPGRALASFLARRAYLALRRPGFRFKRRSEDQIPPATLSRIDACWSATQGFFVVDQIRGLDFHLKHLSLALAAGEPKRVARGLAMEAASMAAVGADEKKVNKHLDKVRSIASEIEDDQLTAWLEGVAGAVAYLQGRWQEAYERSKRAEELYLTRCRGVSWEIDSTQNVIRWSLCFLAKMNELETSVDEGLREAAERGDLFASMSARSGFPNVVWLARDDVETARKQASEGIENWSQEGFHLQHLFDLFAQTQIDLYERRAEVAWERVAAKWEKLEESGLLRVSINLGLALDLRARAAIALAVTQSSKRRELLRIAESDAKRLLKKGAPWTHGLAHSIRGQTMALEGDRQRAEGAFDRAIAELSAAEMPLMTSAACGLKAWLRGDDAAFEEATRSLGPRIARPSAFLSVFAPCLFTRE